MASKLVRRASVLLGVATAAAVVIAACGGGGGATATPRPAATPVPTAAAAAATAVPSPTPAPTATLAPTATPAPQPKRGGTLNARVTSAFTSWDTYDVRGAFSFIHIANVLNSLIQIDLANPSKIVGDLAEGWDVSSDGKEVTFRIRKGVVWQDGRPFTSADVAYNLNSAWKPASNLRSFNAQFMRRVTGIQAPDDFTVKVTLDRPSGAFLPGIATPHMLMYPAHITDLAAWQKSPIGTGPFKFKDFKPDVSIEYVRNDGYWKKDAAGAPLPYLDGIKYNILSADTALAAFRTGQIPCGCGFDTDFMTPNRELLKRDFPDLQLFTFWSPDYIYFNSKPPFNDQRVRQAISIGMDRRKFAAAIQDGFSLFPGSPFFPPDIGGQWGLTAAEMVQIPGWRQDHAADLALAKKLLADAGVNPADVKVFLLGNIQFAQETTLIDADLRSMGFKPSLNIVQRTQDGTAILVQGGFDISFETPGTGIDVPDQYGANRVLTGASNNWGKWSNPELDKLFPDVDSELDPAKRLAIAKDIQRKLIDYAVFVPVPYTGRTQGVRTSILKGYRHIEPLSIDLSGRQERVWLDR